jgi:hypothetical protein
VAGGDPGVLLWVVDMPNCTLLTVEGNIDISSLCGVEYLSRDLARDMRGDMEYDGVVVGTTPFFSGIAILCPGTCITNAGLESKDGTVLLN